MNTTPSDMSRDLVVFDIGDREFAIDNSAVCDIRDWAPATTLPHRPRHIQSVITVDGAVVPLVDMSLQLGLGRADPCQRHTIILVRPASGLTALLVDEVNRPIAVEPARIQPVAGLAPEKTLISSMVTLEDRMICFVELNALSGNVESEAA
ncbi:MAG: chemotaxis protein CheW [Hoeflea sp.]|uniref:chemotaxis protein CheW n=1 Tax=Hoeflea sp. TaxID=1940281 RepID=UPI0032EF8E85